jgi:CubicO group peptidase (beta-lactamase class C family)
MNHGNSGNAGVFSCAEDLALLGQYLLQNKNDKYIKEMTSMPDSLSFSGRTLGWGHNDSITSYTGTLFGPNTYCHTGYTGTSMIVDPDEELCLIILTNRVHPKDKGNLNPLRGAVADAVYRRFILKEDTKE